MYPSFNYIGSKKKLLLFLKDSFETYTNKQLNEIKSFGDYFSGTGIVSNFMMANGIPKIISNDLQYYSYLISSVLNKNSLDTSKLKEIITLLNNIDCHDPTDIDFIYSNYSPAEDCNRMFFTCSNAIKIDRIRQYIEKIKINLTLTEYNCLLKILLYAVTKISNTSSTYGAYLKQFKKSSTKNIVLDPSLIDLLNSSDCNHICFNENILQLNTEYVEICYLDPPYNSRKYCKNYDVLETISKYDNPIIKGITGLRDSPSINTFSSKITAEQDFLDLFGCIKSHYLFMSYSSESLLSKEKIINLLNHNWTNIICYTKEYKRFKSNNNNNSQEILIEYLFAATSKHFTN
jgi:adenine-specific DNA-methyltransferase